MKIQSIYEKNRIMNTKAWRKFIWIREGDNGGNREGYDYSF
jgi:hypothetical protein